MKVLPYSGLVDKKSYTLPGPYTTAAGATIKEVRIGYETIGELNATRDNAILVPHYNSGNSHFAGKYKPDDKAAGYWDAIVGPGKPLDTDKYFLVGVDSLCNINANDGITVTTGPASIDPDTGKCYGMRFPTVQIRDFVNVQKAVMAHLGISKWHAVMGASMGSMQAFEWAASFPDLVGRVIGVVPGPHVDDYDALKLRLLRQMIMLDPKWNGGDYYGTPGPVDGFALALAQMYAYSLAPEWSALYNRKWADPAKDPAQSFDNDFASCMWIDAMSKGRIEAGDPNCHMYIQRANELFTIGGKPTLEEGLALIRCKVLLVPSPNDNILYCQHARKARDILQAQGNHVEYFEITGPMGHLNAIFSIQQAAEVITKFLE